MQRAARRATCNSGPRDKCGGAFEGVCRSAHQEPSSTLRCRCRACPSYQNASHATSCKPCAACDSGVREQCGGAFKGVCPIARQEPSSTLRRRHANLARADDFRMRQMPRAARRASPGKNRRSQHKRRARSTRSALGEFEKTAPNVTHDRVCAHVQRVFRT